MRRFLYFLSLLSVVLLVAPSARAVLDIEITGGVEGDIPIAVVPFAWTGEGQPPEDIAAVVQADLGRSGEFDLLPRAEFLEQPARPEDVHFEKWSSQGVENLLIGSVGPDGKGGYEVRFRLFDTYRKPADPSAPEDPYRAKQILGNSLEARGGTLRHTAHYISDLVYEKLVGVPGVFRTRVAYVTAKETAVGNQYALQVADADGRNSHEVLRAVNPIMSPSWSPDGRRLAYVTFRNRQSGIYIQDLASDAEPVQVSAHPGINGAPSWSPDGRKLALTLSHADAGNPEIYILDIETKGLERITYNSAIDTEPVWSPDGKSIVFTSDRSGRPQLYRVQSGGGRAKRLTFEGSYNAHAAFSPDGTHLAMVHGTQGKFRIALLDLETGLFRVLTEGPLDESPSFAPNGRLILYATGGGARGQLGVVTLEGQITQRLSLQEGDVREPAWGPFTEN